MRSTRLIEKAASRGPGANRPISEIMSRFVETIRPGASVQEAASRMRAFDVGLLPVVSWDSVLGVVTDRDLVTRSAPEGRSALRMRVRDIMSPEVIACAPDTPVEQAVRTMASMQVRRLLITSADGRLEGLLSLADLVRSGYADRAAVIFAVSTRSLRPPLRIW